MRKELILVLLGIICTSFISSLLSGYVQIESDKVLLDTVVGVVGAGNFSYWQLGHTGPLLVELTSLSGDADLYVSENIRPSYEVDRNNFSSATCGSDLVNIPTEFPRPLGIAVFGHWSHTQSEYSIQVFLDAAAEQPGSRKMDLTAGMSQVPVCNYEVPLLGTMLMKRNDTVLVYFAFTLTTDDCYIDEAADNRLGENYPETSKRGREKAAPRKTDEEKPRFLKLLTILDMIFEMFVL